MEELDFLPIRPSTARQVIVSALDQPTEDGEPQTDVRRVRSPGDLDPGWILGEMTSGSAFDPVRLVADRPWWPASCATGLVGEAFQRLWRHSVAVSLAARAIAREAGDLDPDLLSRAGLLHGLGRWAIMAVAPEWVVGWLDEKDARIRRQQERSRFGAGLCELGRRLGERWGCDPLIVDAAWLHDPSSEPLKNAATDPARLAIIQQAFLWAESTPWSLFAVPDHEAMPSEPRLRILIAEVQSRCGALFAAGDATTHEEQLSRHHSRLLGRYRETATRCASQERLIESLAATGPSDSLDSWAEKAGAAWCAEPEVTAASLIWHGPSAPRPESLATDPRDDEAQPAGTSGDRPPTLILPLTARGRTRVEVHLWCDPAQPDIRHRLESSHILPAWRSWASMMAARVDLERRLETVVSGIRDHAEEEKTRTGAAKLDALAEFAAGAGHELNNPLAVIVGRAQLLLGRAQDPELIRSLRIILNQAQRSHRILRDLMFVARPQAPRPRACRPSEVLRASVSGLQEECEARGVRLVSEFEQGEPATWADPEALGHLADVLLRNALQATPPGGKILVRSSRQGSQWRWSVSDSGRGITGTEANHLFDPFYCGRQAGRGLGLGLPRAARMAALAGGSLNWSSTIGQGSSFQVQLPLLAPPEHQVQEALPDRVA